MKKYCNSNNRINGLVPIEVFGFRNDEWEILHHFLSKYQTVSKVLQDLTSSTSLESMTILCSRKSVGVFLKYLCLCRSKIYKNRSKLCNGYGITK